MPGSRSRVADATPLLYERIARAEAAHKVRIRKTTKTGNPKLLNTLKQSLCIVYLEAGLHEEAGWIIEKLELKSTRAAKRIRQRAAVHRAIVAEDTMSGDAIDQCLEHCRNPWNALATITHALCVARVKGPGHGLEIIQKTLKDDGHSLHFADVWWLRLQIAGLFAALGDADNARRYLSVVRSNTVDECHIVHASEVMAINAQLAPKAPEPRVRIPDTVQARWLRRLFATRTLATSNHSTCRLALDRTERTITLESGKKISLKRKPVLYAVVRSLAEAPNGLTVWELFDSAWKVDATPRGATSRVYEAVRSLRALGLSEHIQSIDGRYHLAGLSQASISDASDKPAA